MQDRLVTRTPLAELWDHTGPVAARRSRDLTAADIRELLRAGRVRFVVVNVGSPLRWVPEAECFSFWKAEVQTRVGDPFGEAALKDFPGEYFYFAAEWVLQNGSPLVVLECQH